MYSGSSDDISFGTIKNEWQSYNVQTFKKDLLAGMEVSLLTVPQAMAYALVAGLPISCGLIAAIFSALVAAFMGSSRYLIVGPVNAIAILVQAGTADILFTYYRDVSPLQKEALALEIMTQIALIAGLLQILIAVFKLGRLTQFVSHSVVIGYLAGGAFAIIVSQLFVFTGIPSLEGVTSLFEKLSFLLMHLELTNVPTLLVGLGSLVMLVTCKKMSPRLPSAAIMILFATGLCWILNLSPYSWFSEQVSLIGSSSGSLTVLPFFSLPSFNPSVMNHMLSTAFAVALLSIIETTCTAKSIAATSGQAISISQEILAVGSANIVSSCTGAMPVSVSTSRSQLNLLSGAQTRFSAIFNALFVAFIVGYFDRFIHLTPFSALSALLFVTSLTLVNPKQLLVCWKSTTSDAFVMITTFLACIFLSLDTAFYIGVALSISLYLKRAAVPQLAEYAIEDTGELKCLNLPKAYQQKNIRVIKVEGELFFGSADIFYTTLKSLAEDDSTTRVIILQLKNARDIDATTCLAVQQLYEYLEKGGRYLVMTGMTYDIWDVMSNSGLITRIGKQNLFIFDERHPQLHMQKAIARAKELVRTPLTCPVITGEKIAIAVK